MRSIANPSAFRETDQARDGGRVKIPPSRIANGSAVHDLLVGNDLDRTLPGILRLAGLARIADQRLGELGILHAVILLTAFAPVWNPHGNAIAMPPASKPFLRNLRVSIAITPLPMMCGHTNPFAPKHVVQNGKVSRSDRSPKTQRRLRRFTIRKNKKARQTLAGRSGYIAGPDQQHRWSDERCIKHAT